MWHQAQGTDMDPREWLTHLEQFGIKLGLETIAALVQELGQPHLDYPVIHVAGTNGKGSVSAMVARGLSAAGHRTGLYTSPHLIRLEERFRIDGTSVASTLLDEAIVDVRAAAGRLAAARRLQVEPTFFEATTAAAFLLFARLGVDVAVIEVGLGGRFDATNIVAPVLCAITAIDLDHQAQLGSTLALIAREKAGIVKPGVPVVVGPLQQEAAEVVARACETLGAPLLPAPGVQTRAIGGDGHARVVVSLASGDTEELRLALGGAHQAVNAAIAAGVLDAATTCGLTVQPGNIVEALTATRWPARLETVETARGRVVIDGAHNPAGARALTSYLERRFPAGLPVVFGAMRDKALAEMIAPLSRVARPFVFTQAAGSRAASPEELTAAARAAGVERFDSEPRLADALGRAWTHGPDIAIAGSLYLAGEALHQLGVAVD
jgi:dihydrofolate synthase/folylpolyglutamate synthase